MDNKITAERLRSAGACESGIRLFETLFPDGGYLTDEAIAIAREKGCPSSYVWWFCNNIQQDNRLLSLCGVNESSAVNSSSAVNESSAVSWSNGVDGSNAVSWSSAVSWSNGVNRSNVVRWSNGVNGSDAVNGSNGVNGSYAVNKSYAVNRSNGVNESDAVNWSFGILNSYGVDHALFLANKPRSFTIFGKEVTEERFNEVYNALYSALNGWRPAFNSIEKLWLMHGSDWKETPVHKSEELTKKEAWADMPKAANEFVRSLPEFDAEMFEEITGIETK